MQVYISAKLLCGSNSRKFMNTCENIYFHSIWDVQDGGMWVESVIAFVEITVKSYRSLQDGSINTEREAILLN